MISQKRLLVEKQVLDYGFPDRYRFHHENSPDAYVEIDITTLSGNTYLVKFILGDFPYSPPTVYVMHPEKMINFNGVPLSKMGISDSMLLLQSDEDDHIQLCIYRHHTCDSSVTLYRVALKCLIWLHLYEEHLKTGMAINKFLK